MTSPDTSSGDDELVLNVMNLQYQGRKFINPQVAIQVFSRSQNAYKPAKAVTYHVHDSSELIGIEYVDGSGSKDLSVHELQSQTGKKIRFVFRDFEES